MPFKDIQKRKEYFRGYYQANKHRRVQCREATYKWWIKRKYGLTKEQYDQMVIAQAGRCALCHQLPKGGKRLCVDHSHTTGQVRALLCTACNIRLGGIEDTKFCKAAHTYLQDHS